jgi:diaminohydroxyphosphoribosylaminopyrimidine deaminase/5-amino-6-(5-phosphoribosylamino)uracil reductase
MTEDERYMSRCLQLGGLGKGFVAPNPMVGAVLVHQGRILAEGYHAFFGGPHAEQVCSQEVTGSDRDLIPNAILYVNLEPCFHVGKTAPCADLILELGISKIVIGTEDPNPLVQGKGMGKLRDAGVEITSGVLSDKCRQLNAAFFSFHENKRPYVILKWAQSRDGFISGEKGSHTKITQPVTDRLVHRWRSELSSILVGRRTAVSDNPQLTNRLWSGAQPVRIVLGRTTAIDPGSRLLDGKEKTLFFNLEKNETGNGISYIRLGEHEAVLPQLLQVLCERQLNSLLVEGGAELLERFIESGLWDEARVITGNMYLQQGIRAPMLKNFKVSKEYDIQGDQICEFLRL